VGGLHGFGLADRVLDAVVFTGEGGNVTRPERPDQPYRLAELLYAGPRRIEGDAVGLELVVPVVPRTDPELEAPFRDDVERGRHLREHRGIPEWGRDDEGAESHAFRDGGDRCECGETFEDGVEAVVEVITDPDRVVAKRFGTEGQRLELRVAEGVTGHVEE
jgi:hypothetical protein